MEMKTRLSHRSDPVSALGLIEASIQVCDSVRIQAGIELCCLNKVTIRSAAECLPSRLYLKDERISDIPYGMALFSKEAVEHHLET